MAFETAKNRQAYGKVGIYGEEGSGKTFTAMLIAFGIVEFLGKNAKRCVHMVDSEVGSDYIAHKFEAADIEFKVEKTRALKTLLERTEESVGVADVLIVDSMTHFWEKTIEDYLAKIGRKPAVAQFQDWGIIKPRFHRFNKLYLNSSLHIIACGRLQQVYEYQKSETTGKMELVTTDTKMKAEYFGYEPSLSIHMDRVPNPGQEKAVINRAVVIKDRFDLLNGMTFDYPTFKNFKPFFEKLNIGGEHYGANVEDHSREMFAEDADKSEYWRESKAKQLREEIPEQLKVISPGSTDAAKIARGDIFEILTQRITGEARRSPEYLNSVKYENLQTMVDALKEMRALMAQDPPPVPVDDLPAMCVFAIDNVEARKLGEDRSVEKFLADTKPEKPQEEKSAKRKPGRPKKEATK